MTDVFLVYSTFADEAEAVSVAQTLLSERLVACANITLTRGVYFWEGNLHNEPEAVMIAKTTQGKVPSVIARIKALLRRGSVERPNVLRVADLEVDRLSQQVKRASRRVELTAKEYALLEYLMANAGRVLSRAMIIDHVWDQSFDGATNIVDVYVRHLRIKVDDGHETKLIRTVRGVGYRISDEAN